MVVISIDPAGTGVPRRALRILRAGGLVAFPTDTYYALGAAVADEAAITRLIAAKRRPVAAPMPVLVAGYDQWRTLVSDLPDTALALASHFWPGALTIVCRRAPTVPAVLTGGGETIGVRQPGLPVAVGLCLALGEPVVGTSANLHAMPPPVTAVEVALDLGDRVDMILDGGRCPLARPSTVVDVTQTPPFVVRVGAVPVDAIERVLGEVAGFHSLPRK